MIKVGRALAEAVEIHFTPLVTNSPSKLLGPLAVEV